ncbi:MAG: PrsW family intramembrane metalloprotease [Clostridia bacterium]|nr:PrsW family intramembrane metalloprotease [Clostridia bacterium]
MNPIDTGRFIREQRKKLNLSQSKLAEMLCVEPQTVSKWERGLGMPDYDNLDKLREIFGCTLSEILEPVFNDEEGKIPEASEEKDTVTNLPILVDIIDDNQEIPRKKKRFRLFDFLNKKKISATLEKMFGYEYANTYSKKFLFKNIFKKRSREECETTLTQGMFKSRMNHNVIGLEAPWLYMRLFFFMLICSGISLVLAIVGLNPMPFVIIGGLCSVLPLMMFLFESNFARNLSIIDVGKMFTIGGLCSIILTVITSYLYPSNEIIIAVIFAPVFEEIFKVMVVIFFVALIKPTNMLTGLLIGFSVGAGFSFFENVHYAYNIAIECAIYGDEIIALIGSIFTIIFRTFYEFVMGHHYWTAIFGGIYVLFKKNAKFNFKELFQWRVMLSLLFQMVLHAMWNGASCLYIPIVPFIMKALVCVCSVGSLIVLINIGIAQTRILGIWEDYRSEHKDEAPQNENQNRSNITV